MIKYATIGTSKITEEFIAAARMDDRFFHAVVYSRNREKGEAFAKKNGCCKVITSLDLLAVDKEIDAVYIASPNAFHYRQSMLFIEHKKHVICEKPITASAEEYRALKSLAKKNGVIYMEAITSRHAEWRLKVINAVNEIGKISSARIDYCQRSSRYDSFMAGEHQNIFDMSLYAGTLMDLGIYCVYGTLDLLGMPKDIYAKASFLKNGADGGGCAVFDYGEFLATLTYSKTGQSALGTEIIGDMGTLKIGLISQYSDVCLIKDGKETVICGKSERPVLMSGEVKQFGNFILDYDRWEQEYQKISELAFNVQCCMDKIKLSAGIVYK